MLNSVTKLVKTQIAKQFFVSGMGTVASGVLGFIFYALVARGMSTENVGIFSIATAVIILVSDVANIGLSTGIVSFVAENLATDRKKALGFLKLAFIFKIFICVFIAIIGWLVAPTVAATVFSKPELTSILRLSIVGIVGMLLFSFSTSALQSLQKFFVLAGVNISSNAVRLLIVLYLISVGIFSPTTAILSYSVVFFIFFFVSFAFLPNFWGADLGALHKKKFVEYNLWVGVVVALGALSSRADTFLLARFSTLDQVGVYAVSISFVSIIPQIVTSLAVVIAPKFAAFGSNLKESYIYFKKMLTLFVVIGVCVAIGASLVSLFLIPLVYGNNYGQSVLPAVILIIGQGFFIAAIPVHVSLLYFFKDAKLFSFVGALQLVMIVILGIILIGSSGSVGASVAILVGQVINFFLPLALVMNKFKKL